MPSTDHSSSLLDRVATQRNATILVAILLAMPVAYAFDATFGSYEGSFLLLMILAVGVPSAYDESGRDDPTSKAVLWVLVACAVAAAAFVALYLVGTDGLEISAVASSVGAFILITLGSAAARALR